jgi:hypothetical protein
MYKPRNTKLSTLVVILFMAATARGQEIDAGVWLSAEYQYQVYACVACCSGRRTPIP